MFDEYDHKEDLEEITRAHSIKSVSIPEEDHNFKKLYSSTLIIVDDFCR